MKVMLDLPLSDGGVGRHGRDLVAGLSAIQPAVDLNLVARPRLGFLDRGFTPWGRAAVRVRALSWKADLLHGLHFELPATRIPGVVTVPDLIPLQYPPSMSGSFRRKVFADVVRRSISRASAVIVHSPATVDALQDFDFSTDRVVVIPHGVGEQFVSPTQEQRDRSRERFARGRHYVAAVSSPKPHKNMGLIDEVARRLAVDDIPVCVAGEASPGRQGTSANYLGYLPDPDLQALFAGAEAVIVASRVEGFGLPALESIACGTPVVCGPGLAALPFLEGSVIVVDVEDPAATEHALRSLIASPLRERLGTEGRKIADAMSLEAMAQATYDVYARVLG